MRRRARRALIAAAVAGLMALAGPPLAGAVGAGGAELLQVHVWREDDPAFGGLSGIELSPDGSALVAVSDRGHVVTARIGRDGGGRITGISGTEIRPLRDPEGRPLGRRMRDAEGIAMDGAGRLFVSLEGRHRVWAYAAPGAPAEPLPQHPDFARLYHNAGLEALAIDAEGRLLTLPERSGAPGRPFPVYRLAEAGWEQPFVLPREGAWLPVGADVGPDGRLYLLERDFRGVFGFRSRLSRFALGAEGPGPREVMFETRGPWHDNLESVSVWRDGQGRLRASLVSDDNFFRLQRTEIVEYRLPD